jgi:hypothetical protein
VRCGHVNEKPLRKAPIDSFHSLEQLFDRKPSPLCDKIDIPSLNEVCRKSGIGDNLSFLLAHVSMMNRLALTAFAGKNCNNSVAINALYELVYFLLTEKT